MDVLKSQISLIPTHEKTQTTMMALFRFMSLFAFSHCGNHNQQEGSVYLI